MKLRTLSTLALTALAGTSGAQKMKGLKAFFGPKKAPFHARTLLIEKKTAKPELFPRDSVWRFESYHENSGEFFGPKFRAIHWTKDRFYFGLSGTTGHRIQKLSSTRWLVERRRALGNRNAMLVIDKQRNGDLIAYWPSTRKGAGFADALRRAGLTHHKQMINGDKRRILRFLRTYEFKKPDIWGRLRRPTPAEMKRIWSLQQLASWQARQSKRLSQTRVRIDRMTKLGDLGVARRWMTDLAQSGADKIGPLELKEFEFGPMNYQLKRLTKSAKKNLLRIEEKIKERMSALGRRIKTEHLAPGKGRTANPGDAVRFHFVMKDELGRTMGDSRARGPASRTAIANKMPEGIAFALCSLRNGGKARFEIPADLAYGDKKGAISFEAELIEFVKVPRDKPPLRSTYFGYKLAEPRMKETATKLLFSDMRAGQGAMPRKGQRLVVKMEMWSAAGRRLSKPTTKTIELGSNDNPAGLNEGLATMRPGGVRMLCLPPELGYRSGEFKGTALRIMIGLRRVEQ